MISLNQNPQLSRQSSERFERKFYLPSSSISFAAHLLAHCCPRDRQFPRGTIHSVYYDTADLDHYEESQQGDRLRNKIRIRWYNNLPDAETVQVFLEMKSRKGFTGSKQRKELTVDAKRLALCSLSDGLIPYTHLIQALVEFGYDLHAPLAPMIMISYQRFRFFEPLTGSRISLDWNIQSTLVNPHLDRGQRSLPMEGGVIEIKGRHSEIPAMLRSLQLLETDWSRYSKYASCMQSQLEESGSYGQLAPSGRGDPL